MALSPYIADLRRRVGTDLLLLPSVMGVIFDQQSRVLLVRQAADGRWSTPGGLIEPEETPATAVVREVQEETGLTPRPRAGTFGVRGGPVAADGHSPPALAPHLNRRPDGPRGAPA